MLNVNPFPLDFHYIAAWASHRNVSDFVFETSCQDCVKSNIYSGHWQLVVTQLESGSATNFNANESGTKAKQLVYPVVNTIKPNHKNSFVPAPKKISHFENGTKKSTKKTAVRMSLRTKSVSAILMATDIFACSLTQKQLTTWMLPHHRCGAVYNNNHSFAKAVKSARVPHETSSSVQVKRFEWRRRQQKHNQPSHTHPEFI